ncbi:DNA polymerase III subunit delta' [Desulfovibrio aminophilus]|uniref:DNA polymerase III subunit delta' n=1 Tax=Desulfovibrio aminophilus TaxID=81425 RepID=UPI000406ADEB|nr:DNA polymerase III subunit delta' [Desulfovibrio aminophilus]
MDGGSHIPARQEHVRRRLDALAAHPPQSLVLEGGGADERETLALYWAKLLNCPGGACGTCETCRQIDERVFRDLILVDGAFFESEGATHKSHVERVRELRPTWGQPPHGEGRRVTIFPEFQDRNPEIANTLLKTLEEPRPGNVFVLTAPQRERLLPTLVSRSFILTLAWPDDSREDAEASQWADALYGVWETGRGWFGRTMAKGAVDRDLARRVILEVMRGLRRTLTGESASGADRLARRFDASGLRRLGLALGEAQDALEAQANPTLVLDWLATRFTT